MLDWLSLAIAGIFASGVVEKGEGYLIDTVRGGIIEEHGDKIFCQIVGSIADKFKDNTPQENHELIKAFRRSCVVGMQHVCARRKLTTGIDNSVSLIRKPRNILLGESPTSLFGEDEKQWLVKAERYLKNRIDELDRGLVWLPEPPSEEYRMLVVPKGVSNVERAKQFRQTLINDAVAELSQEVKLPPKGFVDEMIIGWFGLTSNEFQDVIAKDQLLANKFQNQTLVEVKYDTGEIKFTLTEVLELLRELTEKEKQTKQVIVSNLPNLKVEVYDRIYESDQVLRSLCEDQGQFHLVVAPSGFGKTFLLTKVLQNVTDGMVILSDYERIVQRIVLFDCRGTNTLVKIVAGFADLIDDKLAYTPQDNENPKEWLNKYLFPALRRTGTVWLVLENFEAWLDADNDFTVREPEMRVFLNALFESDHSLRVLCLSQSEPTSDIKKQFKEPPEVGEKLFDGLPKLDALDYLRIEGGNVGLDRVDEDLLDEFLRRVTYIPQALSSLIGYLETIKGYGFAEFMADDELWAGFDSYEHESDAKDEGKRRTKALVAKQILAQPKDVKILLRALAFFSRPSPREALESLFKSKARAAHAISHLIAHRVATVTEDARHTKYYELHAYFREQARKVLPSFESLSEVLLINYASNLAFIKGVHAYNAAYFRRAVDLYKCAENIYQYLLERTNDPVIVRDLSASYLNKGAALSSLGRIVEAITEFDKAILILERLVNEEGLDEMANDLAGAYLNKGNALSVRGRPKEAIIEYEKAVLIRERLVKVKPVNIASSLAMSYMNKGSVLCDAGRLREAITEYDEAIKIYERLVNEERQVELRNELAMAYLNKGNAYSYSGRFRDAVAEFDKVIFIRERLVNQERQDKFAYDLAIAYLNKGNSLAGLGMLNEGIAWHGKAIEIYERLVSDEKRDELANELALAYLYKGVAHAMTGKYADAISEYDKAIPILKRLINNEGRGELAHDLAAIYMSKGSAFSTQGELQQGITEYDEAIKIYERLVNEERRDELAHDLAMSYMNKGNAMSSLANFVGGINEYDKAIKIYEQLVNEERREELAAGLAISYMNKGATFSRLEKLAEAITDYDKAIKIYERLVNDEKRDDLTNELAVAYIDKALTLHNGQDWENALTYYTDAMHLLIRCVDEFGRVEVLPNLMKVVICRFNILFELEKWNEAAQNAVKAIRLKQDYLGHPKLSEYFKGQILKYFDGLRLLLRESSYESRQKIYQAAGEYSEVLKQLAPSNSESHLKSENKKPEA
jgi:tetratricopeptide (TPR) repeat protein